MGVGPLISPSLIQLWIDMSRIKVFSLAVATFVIVCLVSALFGKPRPMSSAVMAEYDRQREKAGKFRRASSHLEESDNLSSQNVRRSSVTGQLAPAVSCYL